jgi:ubiquinone biosynthesis protein UbiJ
MLHALRTLLEPAAMGRLTLLLNHVLSREPAAVQRLKGHVGAIVQVIPEGWPSLLPQPPRAAYRVTPAGLLEWLGPEPSPLANLRVLFDASNPAMLGINLLSGATPQVRIEGDSRLATDVDWLVANLRWDIADDLEALFGPVAAQLLTQLGRTLRRGIDLAMKGASDVAARWRPSAR